MKKLLALLLSLVLILSLSACNQSADTSSKDKNENSQTEIILDNLPKIPEDIFEYTYTDADYDRYLESLNNLKTSAIIGSNENDVKKYLKESEKLAQYLSTQHSVANVIYYAENTDEANERFEKIDKLMTQSAAEFYRTYRDIYVSSSPYKDIVFEDWTEEEIESISNLDIDEFVRTRDVLSDILLEFNALDSDKYDWGTKVNNLYFDHVKAANEQAKAWGYDNYYDYMTENGYSRDYSEADRKAFRENVKQYIVPAYINCTEAIQQLSPYITQGDYYEFYNLYSSEYNKLSTNYVDGFINTFDGSMKEKMNAMFDGKHIRYGTKDSLEGAFTAYLEYYGQSVVFLSNGSYKSTSTVVHEMGHFVSLYNYEYSGTSYDLLETHSQGTEWLMMAYLEDKMSDGAFDIYFINSAYTLFDLIIRCAIIDEFEETVYKAATPYKASEYDALLETICQKYGTGINEAFGLENYINHVKIRNPVYYLSYATSALSAANFYVKAKENGYSAAQECYRKLQEGNKDEGFLFNLEYAGLPSPFKSETYRNLCDKFNDYLR